MALWAVSFRQWRQNVFSHRSAHLPHPMRQMKRKTVTTWLGLDPRTHDSVASTHPDGMAGCWEGGSRTATLLAPQAMPPGGAVPQCLLVIMHFHTGE